MLINILIFLIYHIDPFMVINLEMVYLFTNFKVLVGPLINNCQHTIDSFIFHVIRII